MKKNEGEVNQYYVTNSHPAIIEPDEWDIVQSEFKRRKELGRTYSAKKCDRDIWVLLVEKAVVHTNGSIHLNSSVVEQ